MIMIFWSAILSLLLAWLFAVFFRFRSNVVDAPYRPPLHYSWLPSIRHLFGIVTKGSNSYISSLCSTQRSSIVTMNLPGQDVHLIHPLDSASIKHFTKMRHLSLMAVFYVAVGPAMGLVPASKKFLTDPDTGVFKRELSKLFNSELRSLQNLQKYASLLDQKIDAYWDETLVKPNHEVKIGLGTWLFDSLSFSMGVIFWGKEGPFGDDLFRKQLGLFIQNLEDLRNPLSWLVPTHLQAARHHVRRSIDEAVKEEAYGDPDRNEATLFRRLAGLYESLGIPPEGVTDCHLVAIVGLMSNVINMITWALCHIVADRKLMESLLAEVSKAIDESSSTHLIADADQIRNSCPLLVGTWYELLRTYGDSPVARGVTKDALFDGKYTLQKGSIVLVPVHLQSFDKDIWGEDADAFRPNRFLQDDGQVAKELVKHLNVFGLPGMHQCPGRYLGHTMTLAVIAKILLSFDITPAPGDAIGNGSVPKRKETMLGLPVMKRDPEVVVQRRGQVHSVQIVFDNAQSGW